MRIKVKLFGGLSSQRDFSKNEEGDILLELSKPVTVAQLIELLELNKKPFIVVLNGVILNELSTQIDSNSELSLFPPIAGG
ncbi:MoaD/ThiS family protein [Thermodesulfovibrio sp.]|jgi:molybdopterin synthase sulfur carrier subunit|uniref:MoaD/ThiS family protein n=1 Tax=Thermodesulfovibrio TaxID=28261 RepID=UPI00262DA75B|nr:MoaD/ThiS family protein [Thermodesulfovibrio sp.]